MAVTFSYADHKLPLAGKVKVRSFIDGLFSTEGRRVNRLVYVFCSDAYLLEINRQFLNHDTYTDIIAFDLTEAGDNGVVGEIYVSVERVIDNAAKLNEVLELEILRVLFHGALHLCGYGDKKKSEIAVMRHKEDEYLRLYKQTLF